MLSDVRYRITANGRCLNFNFCATRTVYTVHIVTHYTSTTKHSCRTKLNACCFFISNNFNHPIVKGHVCFK